MLFRKFISCAFIILVNWSILALTNPYIPMRLKQRETGLTTSTAKYPFQDLCDNTRFDCTCKSSSKTCYSTVSHMTTDSI